MGNKKQRAKASQPQRRGKAKSSGPTAKSSKNVENKAAKGAKAKAQDSDADARRTGLRGAAPWAARHAAKHAAEARARNAQPPPPGSARATLRVPEKAEQIKAKVAELHNHLVQIRALRKNLADRFFELGKLLGTIREHRLYEAKGYTSFESFLEREVDLSKGMLLRLERMPRVFRDEVAAEIGLDGLVAALDAIDAVAAGARPAAPAVSAPPHLPLKPPARRK